VQGLFDWLFGKKPDPKAHYKDLSESDRQKAVFLDNIHEHEMRERQERTRWGRGFFLPEVQSTTESHALETAQTVVFDRNRVVNRRRARVTAPWTAVMPDAFTGPIGLVVFRRDASGRATGLSISQDRVWDLRFKKTSGVVSR
jgi:hypothetical protein